MPGSGVPTSSFLLGGEAERKKQTVVFFLCSSAFSHGEHSQRQQGVELVAFTDQQKLPGRMQGG